MAGHKWVRSESVSECDLVVVVNSNRQYTNKQCVNWLYEPESILPNIYRNKSVNRIATHITDTYGSNIVIPPCFPSWIDEGDRKIYNKSKLVSMIASRKNMCNGHTFRQVVADRNSKTLDLYGFGRERVLKTKVDGLRDYMFSVAMENGKYDVYYTEKILDCFLTGTIPIYWGSPKITNVFDTHGIITLNDDGSLPIISKEIYLSKLESVRNNFEIAKKMNHTSSDGIQFIVDKI